MSHEPPPASFLNDDSIYYVNNVYDKRKLNIKRWEVLQVADHILMCINVKCKMKGEGGGKDKIHVKHEKFVAIKMIFFKKKCRYFIEELEN